LAEAAGYNGEGWLSKRQALHRAWTLRPQAKQDAQQSIYISAGFDKRFVEVGVLWTTAIRCKSFTVSCKDVMPGSGPGPSHDRQARLQC